MYAIPLRLWCCCVLFLVVFWGHGQDGRRRRIHLSLEDRTVMRTHTSSVQIHYMLAHKPPFRMICTGKVYRKDSDATHSPMFHQCEGLAIDRALHLGHLKGCVVDFLRTFFGIATLPVRFRSSYFPFTEPSMEVDIGWNRKTGELGGGGDWLEIMGSGMVHPKVLANCGIDPRAWQGFAFGMGIERIAMLKLGIADLRPFYDADLRWPHAPGRPLRGDRRPHHPVGDGRRDEQLNRERSGGAPCRVLHHAGHLGGLEARNRGGIVVGRPGVRPRGRTQGKRSDSDRSVR